MDLKVLSTGKTFRRIDTGVAALLLEMFPAAIERVNEPNTISPGQRELASALPSPGNRPAPPKETLYDVVPAWFGGFHIRIRRPSGEIQEFGGDPAAAPKEVPASVVEQYRQMQGPSDFARQAAEQAEARRRGL